MKFDILFFAQQSSAAFRAGEAIGMVFAVILMLLVPAVFILCLVQLVRTKKRGWLVGLICSAVPVLIFAGLVVFGAYQAIVSSAKTTPPGSFGSRPLPAGGVVSPDGGGFSMETPENWKLLANLHEEAGLQAGNLFREEYLIVLTEAKEDFGGGIVDFADLTAGNMVDSLADAKVSEVREFELDGMPAVQRKISGTVDLVKIVYLHTALESDTRYHQVLAWTVKSKESSAIPVFEDAVKTIRKVPESGF